MSDSTRQLSLITTSGYERDVRKLVKQNPDLLTTVEHTLDILEQDPYNTKKQYDIKKLKGIKEGQGQWRIRIGKYRIRYDIINQDVVLYSFSHRKEAYNE